MRFLRKNNIKKTVLVISDLHLGAGKYLNNKFNPLEDFHYDRELVEFLDYYSSGEFENHEIDLVINGDFLDILAVPYIKCFDDEFWNEESILMKLDLIFKAHHEVFEALGSFLKKKNKRVTYIIGNHDAEMIFPSAQEKFKDLVSGNESVTFITPENGIYSPMSEVAIVHGHEYELAHGFNASENIKTDQDGKKYFQPPWGAYYVTKVINRYKRERSYVNSIRPIRRFLINGIIYDTLFTFRFMLGNAVYFFMARAQLYFKRSKNIKDFISIIKEELELFRDDETIMEEFFEKHGEYKVFLIGHTHNPQYRSTLDGKVFINTGTWTNMRNLDFGRPSEMRLLTYAQIDEISSKKNPTKLKRQARLQVWKGVNKLPYYEMS